MNKTQYQQLWKNYNSDDTYLINMASQMKVKGDGSYRSTFIPNVSGI